MLKENNHLNKLNLIATIFSLAMVFLLTNVSIGQAGNLTMTTYYPAPQGAYDRLTLIPQATVGSSCIIGTLITEQTTGKLLYCHNDGAGNGIWGPASGVWTQNNNNVFPSATPTNPDIFVGIGTNTPEFKLTLDNDGGILAMGQFGTGQILPDFVSPSGNPIVYRFIWYPRKAVFRVLEIVNQPTATNDASMGDYSIAFGKDNFARQTGTMVGGGENNNATAQYSTIIGGSTNVASGDYSTITGGLQNDVSGQFSVISGEKNKTTADKNTINGGLCNFTGGIGATVGGGNYNNATALNDCTGPASSALYSAIGGGLSTLASGNYSTIGGGSANRAAGIFSVVGGGRVNDVVGDYSTVSGGRANVHTGSYSVTAGGHLNNRNMYHTGNWSVITGGMGLTTTADYSVIIGGRTNRADGQSSVLAGESNITGGYASVVAGGGNRADGDYSWSGGRSMQLSANADRTFLWGYSGAFAVSVTTPDSFIIYSGKVGIRQTAPSAILDIKKGTTEDYLAITSTSAATPGDKFIIKNNGYVGIGNSNPGYPLQIGNSLITGFLTIGGVWTLPSSRAYKENIITLDRSEAMDAVLKLRPVTYNYKLDKSESYVGFIAEDVPDLVAATGRNSVDPMNVTAILTMVLKEQKKEIQEQENILNILDIKLKKLENQLHH